MWVKQPDCNLDSNFKVVHEVIKVFWLIHFCFSLICDYIKALKLIFEKLNHILSQLLLFVVKHKTASLSILNVHSTYICYHKFMSSSYLSSLIFESSPPIFAPDELLLSLLPMVFRLKKNWGVSIKFSDVLCLTNFSYLVLTSYFVVIAWTRVCNVILSLSR